MAGADAENKIAEAAFRVLAKKRWDALTLADVAKAAKLSLPALLREVPAKPRLIGLLLQRSVADTLKRYKPDRSSHTPRERAFDVAMCWFEALGPRKTAVRNLHGGLVRDPLALIAARQDILSAAATLLALAEADTGPSGLKAIGFALALARAIPAWLADGKDLSKTMASLDGDFGRAEDLSKRFGKKSKRAGG